MLLFYVYHYYSPHLCVGFLFLILYPASSASSSSASSAPSSALTPSFTLSFTPSFTHQLSTLTHFFHTQLLLHTIFNTPSLSHTIFHTIFHTPTLSHTIFHTQTHTTIFHIQLCLTQTLSHTIFHTQTHTTIFHIQLCLTQTLSHTIFHTQTHTTIFHIQLCLTPSLSHTIFHFGTWRHPPSFRVACVALGHIHLRFAWQAWHLWHWAGSGGALGRAWARWGALGRRWRRPTLRGRRGTWRHPSSFRVAGVALGDIHLRSAWQAWHALGHFYFSIWSHSPSFRMAVVALMALGFVLRGRRGTLWHWAGSGGALGRWGALGRQWSRRTLRGSRGTWRHPSSFRVLVISILALEPSFRVAGVALGHIHLRFAWQAWHLWHWAGSGGALAGARLVAGDAAQLCVAGMALGDIHLRFAWQVCHLATSTCVLRGRRGTWSLPLWHLATSTFESRGRCGTWSHSPSFCVAGVALMDMGWLWWRAGARLVAGDAAQLCVAGVALGHFHFGTWQHPPSFRVAGVALGHIHFRFCVAGVALMASCWLLVATHHLSHTPSFTHHLCHTQLSRTIFVTHHLSHTILVTYHLSHKTLSHTPSFTQNFVTHHLSQYSYHVVLLWSPWPKQKLQATNLACSSIVSQVELALA